MNRTESLLNRITCLKKEEAISSFSYKFRRLNSPPRQIRVKQWKNRELC